MVQPPRLKKPCLGSAPRSSAPTVLRRREPSILIFPSLRLSYTGFCVFAVGFLYLPNGVHIAPPLCCCFLLWLVPIFHLEDHGVTDILTK